MDTFTKHQIKIAKSTLKMSDAGAKIMGGMSKEDAREILRKNGYTDQQIRSMEEKTIKGNNIMHVKKNRKAEKKSTTITVDKDVRIPGTKIILEKGDKIEILSEAVDQTISASNDCASIDVSIYEDDERQQFVSGNISFGKCMASGVNYKL